MKLSFPTEKQSTKIRPDKNFNWQVKNNSKPAQKALPYRLKKSKSKTM